MPPERLWDWQSKVEMLACFGLVLIAVLGYEARGLLTADVCELCQGPCAQPQTALRSSDTEVLGVWSLVSACCASLDPDGRRAFVSVACVAGPSQ